MSKIGQNYSKAEFSPQSLLYIHETEFATRTRQGTASCPHLNADFNTQLLSYSLPRNTVRHRFPCARQMCFSRLYLHQFTRSLESTTSPADCLSPSCIVNCFGSPHGLQLLALAERSIPISGNKKEPPSWHTLDRTNRLQPEHPCSLTTKAP